MSEPIVGRMLIDGKLVGGLGDQWLDSVDPVDESIIGRVPLGTRDDVEAAVVAADAAQKAWVDVDIKERSALIYKLADALEARAKEISELETRDTGNTIGPMLRDVHTAADRMRLYAGLGYEIKGQTIPATAGGLHVTTRVPFGIVGRIIPFNHPVAFAASRLAPALMSGNSIIIKPSEQSPLSACVLAEIYADLIPPGLVNIVTGDAETGAAIVRHPKIRRLAFIGSVSTGMAIQRAAAEVAVKTVTLELGGKNPMIVCPDADLDAVAAAAVRGMNFAWQGQSCGSTSRLLLHNEIHDKVLEKVVERVAKLKIGNPLDPSVNMGPMNSKAQLEKTLNYIQIAHQEGARIAYGGHRPVGGEFEKGYWVEPTVLSDVKMSMRVAKEEIFGPVLSVFRWSDLDEAIEMANNVDYGLTAAIWTKDIDRALYLARKVESGYLWINTVGTHFRNVPYGGLKNSGVGTEEGLDEMLSYTQIKAINFAA
ncbi:aldehyde dehydrogenase family protein [Rhizobium leguminosarum]|uniref:aldehyde dehydrogenase family protein n=1 Tax=Rhizobium leguminosarum TaxID=384 RepID=UPI001C93F5D7|nr:aldehyde dehydrogenase family protein [Rhizobium leguminosarum]MBY5827563.1 aldehyde dehydrogenase family protein [Rhizobium leguminosarum]